MGGSAVTAVAVVAAGVLAVVAVLRYRLVVVDVDGSSMEPAFASGDRVLVRRSKPQRIRRGDVVVIASPDQGHDHQRGGWMIKRAAAVPGDPVPAGIPEAADRVPSDKLVVLGDNAARSYDSSVYGFLPAANVLGVVLRKMSR